MSKLSKQRRDIKSKKIQQKKALAREELRRARYDIYYRNRKEREENEKRQREEQRKNRFVRIIYLKVAKRLPKWEGLPEIFVETSRIIVAFDTENNDHKKIMEKIPHKATDGEEMYVCKSFDLSSFGVRANNLPKPDKSDYLIVDCSNPEYIQIKKNTEKREKP